MIRARGTNGANYGLGTDDVIAWLHELDADHPFELTMCSDDSLGGYFRQPVRDARKLARRMYKFCPDIVDQGTETVANLARSLEETQDLFFWWD